MKPKMIPSEIPPPSPVSENKQSSPSAFLKIHRINALTGILSNKAFLNVLKEVDEGDFILEVFAKAIETELENMFHSDKAIQQNVSELVKAIDICYAKITAISNSPVQLVLDRLLTNLGNSVSSPPPANVMPTRVRGEGVIGY